MALTSLPANSRSLPVRVLTTLLAVAALMAGVPTGVAQAYGTPVDPPSRTHGCWQRWGADPLNPTMPQVDPMCWQLWQSDPSGRWFAEGVSREGAAGPVPNGRLCSAGQTRYAALDKPGRWQAALRGRQFTVVLSDRTRLGADYLRVYLTKQGYDATTTPLGWNHLDLVASIGRITNVEQFRLMVDASHRTGRHVMYSVWQVANSDRAYYSCTDLLLP